MGTTTQPSRPTASRPSSMGFDSSATARYRGWGWLRSRNWSTPRATRIKGDPAGGTSAEARHGSSTSATASAGQRQGDVVPAPQAILPGPVTHQLQRR